LSALREEPGSAARQRSGWVLAIQVGNLARRSVLRTLRQPAMVVPAIVFPMMLLAINSSGLHAATHLPGFPTNSYLTFALAVCFVQGALFAAMSAGTNLANDVETGFLNRLSLTPLRKLSLLLGQLAGVVTLGLIQAITFVVVGAIAGAHFKAGLAGALVIIGLALLVSLAFGSLGAFVALRAGSAEAVQGVFPLMFAALFLSSQALPRPLIEQDWFREVATYNPVSYMLEGVRSLLITGWDAKALALAFGLAGTVAVIMLAAASLALRERMTRT
jgi:ABC-2 type transport system permease protein